MACTAPVAVSIPRLAPSICFPAFCNGFKFSHHWLPLHVRASTFDWLLFGGTVEPR